MRGRARQASGNPAALLEPGKDLAGQAAGELHSQAGGPAGRQLVGLGAQLERPGPRLTRRQARQPRTRELDLARQTNRAVAAAGGRERQPRRAATHPLRLAGAELETTVQLWLAGVASTLPTASVARTANACKPSPRPLYARGDEHAAHGPPSRRHSKFEPASDPVNPNAAVVEIGRAH